MTFDLYDRTVLVAMASAAIAVHLTTSLANNVAGCGELGAVCLQRADPSADPVPRHTAAPAPIRVATLP